DLPFGIGIEFGELAQTGYRHAGHVGRLLQRVVGNEFCVFVEADVPSVVRLAAAGGLLLQRVIGAQAIADIGLAALEDGVPVDKVPVNPPGGDDVVGDGVEDREI